MLTCALSLPTSFAHYSPLFFFFFFNDTATTEIYTLSLHDALPISVAQQRFVGFLRVFTGDALGAAYSAQRRQDRKSTRLNSSHVRISYAVFCLKKKKNKKIVCYKHDGDRVASEHYCRGLSLRCYDN